MIYGLMIVGEGEAKRYLEPCLDRALRWADELHVAFEPDAGNNERILVSQFTNNMSNLRCSADENEGMAKNHAWDSMVYSLRPNTGDSIGVIKPTEVVLNPDALRKTVKSHPDMALNVTINHLWDNEEIRIDGSWAPHNEIFIVPWKAGATYPDYRLRVGRLPTYHFTQHALDEPVSDVLDYDMLTLKDKIRKWEWFDKVGAGDFFSIDHIQSIKRNPTLRRWQKGGVLHVGQRENVG